MNDALEVRHLRLVRAIADEGGPTRAAARLHLTQSAVSHQLAELEGKLGISLFARVRRRLVPTPAGARLIEEARALLGELARVEKDLYRAGQRKRETLRVAVECSTSYHWLPRVASALAEEAPEVDIKIVLAATREPIVALMRGSLDVAIVSSPVHERALATAPLFADQWAVIAAPSHRFAARSFVSEKELAGETVYALDATRSDAARMRDLIAAEGASMPRIITVPLTDALVEFVKAGLGVGLVSRWSISPYAEKGEIAARRFTKAGLDERWIAVTRRDSSGSIPRFIELTRELGAPPKRWK